VVKPVVRKPLGERHHSGHSHPAAGNSGAQSPQ
jgi:hypothetical protein